LKYYFYIIIILSLNAANIVKNLRLFLSVQSV